MVKETLLFFYFGDGGGGHDKSVIGLEVYGLLTERASAATEP